MMTRGGILLFVRGLPEGLEMYAEKDARFQAESNMDKSREIQVTPGVRRTRQQDRAPSTRAGCKAER